ncbi:ABC transporter ATP-binding protein [Leucobacter rhizosphaerae]|uniref:ABC transporter ATP-binding protein n=1 Tax=Leucobacter rhizosphaerae TaxID=2932245 RepID=A0ABY4FZU5_9MICO|nr:ABC transporter ATP-binding protein [Leucobacter rhizosphaerae]UOQ61791.1 ABC transporter ATP-binding protein [Leucobacter rhizosphaerae]
MAETLLEIRGLRISLPTPNGAVEVVRDASIEVKQGEIVGLAGESGSGKTMTSSAVLGLLPPSAQTGGEIMFGGRDLLQLSAEEMNRVRGREISMVFQDPGSSLHPLLRIGTQITEHLRYHLGLSRAAANARAVELLHQVRIPNPKTALSAYPHQFSGGQRQRAAIAIALACDPKLIIADEPTTALDVTVQAGVLRLFDRLSREMGLSILFITHDLGVLSSVTDRSYIFRNGAVVESGVTADVLNRPQQEYTRSLIEARFQSLAERVDRAEPADVGDLSENGAAQ